MGMLKRIAWAFLVLHHIAWSGVDEEDTTVVIVAADSAVNEVKFSPDLSTRTDDNSQQEGASSSSSSSEILKSLIYYAGLLASSSGGSLLGVHVGAHTGIYAGTLVTEYMMPDLGIKTVISRRFSSIH